MTAPRQLGGTVGGSFRRAKENPYGPDAGLCFGVNDNLKPDGKVMVIPDINVVTHDLQPLDSPVFKQPDPTHQWAFEAALTSVQLALLVALTSEMQDKVGALQPQRPDWQNKIGHLHDTLKAAYDEAKILCGAVDGKLKPSQPST